MQIAVAIGTGDGVTGFDFFRCAPDAHGVTMREQCLPPKSLRLNSIPKAFRRQALIDRPAAGIPHRKGAGVLAMEAEDPPRCVEEGRMDNTEHRVRAVGASRASLVQVSSFILPPSFLLLASILAAGCGTQDAEVHRAAGDRRQGHRVPIWRHNTSCIALQVVNDLPDKKLPEMPALFS